MQAAPTSRIRQGEVIADRFQILSPLGSGGFGDVYLAEQRSTGREVALKILCRGQTRDAETVERFHREARQTCQLTHSNTVTCFDFGEDRSRSVLFIAMEYLPGEALSARLRREGSLSPMTVLTFLEQIAGSLDEAHRKGMIHRDIKPANIMLVERNPGEEMAKVIDFGIAKIVDDGGQPPLTAMNTVLGTPHYMSPEQIQGYPLDARADVYSLGALVFQMLAGRKPYEGAKDLDVLKAHIYDPIPNIFRVGRRVDLPPAAAAVVTKALAKDREQRWPSAAEFAMAFRGALLDAPVNYRLAPPPPPPSSDHDTVLEVPSAAVLREDARLRSAAASASTPTMQSSALSVAPSQQNMSPPWLWLSIGGVGGLIVLGFVLFFSLWAGGA